MSKLDNDDQEIMKNNFFENGNFYILGHFDETISNFVVPNFVTEIEKKTDQKDATIKFYINSYGGYVKHLKELMALFDLAKSKGIIIETHVLGHAYSCGSMLAIYGTKGHRYINKYGDHLCHLGAGGTFARNDIELERQTADLKNHFDFVRDLYKKYAKIKNLEKVINDDSLYIRGQDLLNFGLADKFIGD